MNYLKELLMGLLIGVANIAPGVSGGTLAVSMGVYEKILYAITHITKEPKKSIRTLLPYIGGAALGVAGLSFAIEYFFNGFPLETGMVFLGLIAGGLPAIVFRARKENCGLKGPAAMVLMLAVILIITACQGREGTDVELGGSLAAQLKLLAVGMLGAATMVVPGVSGSILLLMMGYYRPIIGAINDFMRSLAGLDLWGVWLRTLDLLPFTIGFMLGFFLCAKVVTYFLERYEAITYWAVIGLILSSPFVIFADVPWAGISAWKMVSSMAMFLISYELVQAFGGERKDDTREAAES